MAEANWYVVHTYSGYENKVRANILKTIENNQNLAEQILEVRVPEEVEEEIRNGSKKTVTRKLFPGYVFLNMEMNDDTWYVVRNTRGVTGFVGPGSKPVPLTPEELRPFGIVPKDEENSADSKEAKNKILSVDFAEGDTVRILAEGWTNEEGVVQKIDFSRQKVTVNIDIFGRSTPLELDFYSVSRV